MNAKKEAKVSPSKECQIYQFLLAITTPMSQAMHQLRQKTQNLLNLQELVENIEMDLEGNPKYTIIKGFIKNKGRIVL